MPWVTSTWKFTISFKKNGGRHYLLSCARESTAFRHKSCGTLGYCFTPYQQLRLYNGAPLVAFYDTLGIRRTYSRLKPPASSRGFAARILSFCRSLCWRSNQKKHYKVRLGYCFTPYQRLWLYNGAPLVAFYDTLGIRRTYSRLKPPVPL